MNLTHAYWSEIMQLIVAVIGLGILHWSLWDAIRDSTALGASNVDTSGGRMILALNNVRAEMIKVTIMAVLVLSGVVAILMPPPTSYHYEITDPQIQPLVEQLMELDPRILDESNRQRVAINVARWLEIGITILLLIDSLFSRRTRAMFVRRISYHRATSPPPAPVTQSETQLVGAVAGAEAGAKAGAEAGAASAVGTPPDAPIVPGADRRAPFDNGLA